MKPGLVLAASLAIMGLSSSALGQSIVETYQAPQVSGTPQITYQAPLCGEELGDITQRIWETENGMVSEFSHEGQVYGFTVLDFLENETGAIIRNYGLIDTDGDGDYGLILPEDVICPPGEE